MIVQVLRPALNLGETKLGRVANEALRHHIQPDLALASSQLTLSDHRRGFPCCVWPPLRTCYRHYPRRSRGIHSLGPFRQLRPSPKLRRVASCVTFFEACSAFTHAMACPIAKSPMIASSPKAPTTSLPPSPLRLVPGRATQFPGGSTSRCGPAPFHGALNNAGQKTHFHFSFLLISFR